ncbi:MAG: ABC transporter ATP-binding protein [Nitrospira sp.]|nr:ABC transporter ATP-binding protein [Nitrospira sp.]
MDRVLLEAGNIEAGYGPVTALRGVSLRLAAGEIVAVLGANGAGKSTLLKVLSGTLAPTRGEVRLEGEPIGSATPDRLVRRGLVHVPEGREVFPLLSVRDNLVAGAYLRDDADAVAADFERMYGYFPVLRERRAQPAGLLSGGEQQMLAIARALMARPRVLLLDEPSLGLSPALVKEIFAIVARINAEAGVGVLLVEQNAAQALATAVRGYVLELGRIVMEESSARLLANDDIREFYLGIKDRGVRGQRRWKRRKQWR